MTQWGREAAPTDGIEIPRVDPGADGVGWSAMDARAAWSCVIGAVLTPHRQFRPGGGWTVARATGVAVFHNRIVAYPGRDVGGSNAPIFRMIGPDSLRVGTWGAAIVDGLDPREDELVLDRVRMSAFSRTSLDVMLRNLAVTDVVVVGVWTNMAIGHTVRDAADHGYRVMVVSDATSSTNDDWQQTALDHALTNIATSAATVAAALRSAGR